MEAEMSHVNYRVHQSAIKISSLSLQSRTASPQIKIATLKNKRSLEQNTPSRATVAQKKLKDLPLTTETRTLSFQSQDRRSLARNLLRLSKNM